MCRGHAGSGLTYRYLSEWWSRGTESRIHYPGAGYHVMLRGNAGRDIFVDESDRIGFYNLLGEGVKRFDVRIAAA